MLQSAQHLCEKREGSGFGSIHPTNRSGFGRPKNMVILRIRIPNTVTVPTVHIYLLRYSGADEPGGANKRDAA
jgi:hypothetical protein